MIDLACGALAALLAQAPGGWLSASEQARLATFTSTKRREQFIAARWQARLLLAQAHGGAARDWRLEAPAAAPPFVEGRPDLFVSISHSGGFTACAVSHAPIGLDLESPQRQRELEGLIELCCTPAERALFAAADSEALFYELWTVKEAWLKRRGEWLAPKRLAQIEARPGEGEARTWAAAGQWRLALCAAPGAVRWWTPEPAGSGCWQVTDREAMGCGSSPQGQRM